MPTSGETALPSKTPFSLDGARIVTASHRGRDPATGKMKHWATVWPRFQRFSGLDAPELWTATRYCSPIELRKELLGVSAEVAAEQLASCQRRVAEANAANAANAANNKKPARP